MTPIKPSVESDVDVAPETAGAKPKPGGADREDAVGEEAVREETISQLMWWLLRTRALLGGLVVAILGILVIWGASYLRDPSKSVLTYSIRAIGSGLLVTGVVTVLAYLFVRRHEEQFRNRLMDFIAKDLTRRLKKIETRIQGQTVELFEGSASLEALNQRGVARVYANRRDSIDDLTRELKNLDEGEVRIMGVSLNDFVRSDQVEGLHSAWDELMKFVHGTRAVPKGASLEIRILVVDPNCFGARLRSQIETEESDRFSQAGRLESDVEQTIEHLRELVESTENQSSGVSFAFHIYQLPPTLFVCDAESFCYTQPYYFWSHRDQTTSMPLLKLRIDSGLQKGIRHHFDTIWNYGSIDGCEWLDGHYVGSDKGTHTTGMVNFFTDPKQVEKRMLWVLKNAKKKISIQGNSLHSFFKAGDLFNELRAVLKDKPDVRVRALLLDPDCRQAVQRSYREYALARENGDPQMPFDDYNDHRELHRNMELYQESQRSIDRIRSITKPGRDFEARLYDSAPACFMLIVDDHVFVEQYGFGKKLGDEERKDGIVATLGGDMPLVEYRSEASPMYECDGSSCPYDVLEDHFEFVFKHLSRPIELGGQPNRPAEPAHAAAGVSDGAHNGAL